MRLFSSNKVIKKILVKRYGKEDIFCQKFTLVGFSRKRKRKIYSKIQCHRLLRKAKQNSKVEKKLSLFCDVLEFSKLFKIYIITVYIFCLLIEVILLKTTVSED